MPTLTKKLTDTEARRCPVPSAGYAIHWCPKTPGFGVRVTQGGARSWILERRIAGRTVRRTLGPVAGSGRGAISAEVARTLAAQRSGEMALGRDVVAEQRAARAIEKKVGMTFAEALREYIVDDSVRAHPLKERTWADYLGMIRGEEKGTSGKMRAAGELYDLADVRLDALTGAKIKGLYIMLRKRSPMRAAYAMRVLRGVLNYHGVRPEDDPFDKKQAGRERIKLPPARARERVIPKEKLGAWWKAAGAAPTGDYFKLMLLTGMRRGEAAAVKVADVDLEGGRIRLEDTKNRRNHTVLLSGPALEIVEHHAAGKMPYDMLLDGAGDPRKSLAMIVKASGVPFSAHDCRRTFATIAAGLLPGYVVKTLLNHASAGDVTAGHYVHLDEATLRTAWQRVADYILEQLAQ